ncbi:MAG: Mpo1-like protein [Fuerstiella sp.]
MIRRFLANYLPRHRNRTNRFLHLLGVPLAFVVAPVLAVSGYPWYVHVGCFVGGYCLQFAGHAVEGNDAGEVVFFKRMLRLPYNEYASHSNDSSASESSDDSTSAV